MYHNLKAPMNNISEERLDIKKNTSYPILNIHLT